MKYKLLSLFVALVATTALWASNVITYTAKEKLTETTVINSSGLHTNAFNVAITSHKFSNGTGTITFAGEVTTIGEWAFFSCSGLTSVTIPNSVTTIGWYAFYWCTGLTSITIPNSVTKIGWYAFYWCNGLKKTNYTGTVADWCKIKFDNYSSNPICYSHNFFINDVEVKDLVIPNSVTTIGAVAFAGCSGLTSVMIPNSVTTIREWAFFSCSSLTSVTILNPNVKIDKDAFKDCTITDLYCAKSVDLSAVGGTIQNVHHLSEDDFIILLPFDQYARQHVEPQINEWQKKGEFEKTTDWQKRVNETTRKQKIDSLVRVAKKEYLANYQKNNNLTFTLGTYDADNEVYLVQSSNKEDLLVAVPITEASYVKQNWESHTASPQYDIQGTEVVITSVAFSFPNNKIYSYKANEKLTYSTTDISYNFDPIELPEMQTVTMGGAVAQSPQAPQNPQYISSVAVTTPFDINMMSSALVSYKTLFGKYEMPEKDEPFPFVVFRMKLTGTPNLIRLAKQTLALDLGQMYITEQTVPQDDKILFLVPVGVRNIYLTDGTQRQLIYSGRLMPNKIYDGTIEVK